MTRRKRGSIFLAMLFGTALLLGAGATAQAVTYSGCDSCFGSVYELNFTTFSSNATTTTYDFAYSVNTSGYTGAGSGLDAVAFKVTAESNIVSSSLLSQPGTTFSDPVFGSLSAGGCNGAASGGFICTQSSSTGGLAVPNGTYSYTFRTTLLNGTLFGDPNQWSIKALYVNSDGQARGLTSQSGAVPIPGTLLMFGVGFGLLLVWRHRSRHRIGPVGLAA